MVGPPNVKYVFKLKLGLISLVNAGSLSINTVSPFTEYQRHLVIPISVGRDGDTTMKTRVIASCESWPSRRRRCYIIPGLVLRQCATSLDTSENSTTYLVVRTVCMSSSYRTIQLSYRGRPYNICRTLVCTYQYVHTARLYGKQGGSRIDIADG